MLIEAIQSPADIRKLDTAELTALAGEIRSGLMNRLSKRGGHFGPNFGIVEATIALHYVFDSPKDKFVFDVSHHYCAPIHVETCRDTSLARRIADSRAPIILYTSEDCAVE